MHLRYDAHRTGSVTKYHTRNIASASSSPLNAIESILFLVCVVILFFLFNDRVSDGIQHLYKSCYSPLCSDQHRGRGIFHLRFAHPAWKFNVVTNLTIRDGQGGPKRVCRSLHGTRVRSHLLADGRLRVRGSMHGRCTSMHENLILLGWLTGKRDIKEG
jgi:hypothetical protein